MYSLPSAVHLGAGLLLLSFPVMFLFAVFHSVRRRMREGSGQQWVTYDLESREWVAIDTPDALAELSSWRLRFSAWFNGTQVNNCASLKQWREGWATRHDALIEGTRGRRCSWLYTPLVLCKTFVDGFIAGSTTLFSGILGCNVQTTLLFAVSFARLVLASVMRPFSCRSDNFFEICESILETALMFYFSASEFEWALAEQAGDMPLTIGKIIMLLQVRVSSARLDGAKARGQIMQCVA